MTQTQTTNAILHAKILVAGMVLAYNPGDNTYTANVRGTGSRVVESKYLGLRQWSHRVVEVPWDIRVDQKWLRENPGKWSAA